MKYGVWKLESNFWCRGRGPIFNSIEIVPDGKDCCPNYDYRFSTKDLNFAFRYREDIHKRNPTLFYEVREQ